MTDCPSTPEATEALLERIGPIRNTHYGQDLSQSHSQKDLANNWTGGFYDFTSNLSSKDTAYTSEALELHTDTTYFTEPAALQMFHMLSHEGGEGGQSQLADGFEAAAYLQQRDPDAYECLKKVRFFPHASGNEGISIQPSDSCSVFSHHRLTNKIHQIRWNNADRAAFDMTTVQQPEGLDDWYSAARSRSR